MAGVESKNFDSPDETRTPDKTKVEVVKVGGAAVGRLTLQPGWRWSESIKPVVGTDDCQVHHLGFLLSGRMHIVHSDGSEVEIGPNDVYNIQPGHDAWVLGDEEVVGVEFDTAAATGFAKD
jgi:mannose-6-phosphate isomerase-like protein (cupin superfamily)